jgi:hypothetical protein
MWCLETVVRDAGDRGLESVSLQRRVHREPDSLGIRRQDPARLSAERHGFCHHRRSDSCRFEGLDEAIAPVNAAADSGADMGMVFPRDTNELQQAPKLAKIPPAPDTGNERVLAAGGNRPDTARIDRVSLTATNSSRPLALGRPALTGVSGF